MDGARTSIRVPVAAHAKRRFTYSESVGGTIFFNAHYRLVEEYCFSNTLLGRKCTRCRDLSRTATSHFVTTSYMILRVKSAYCYDNLNSLADALSTEIKTFGIVLRS